MILGFASQSYAGKYVGNYAIFTPSSIATLKSRAAKDPDARSYLVGVSKFAAQSASVKPSAKQSLDIEGQLNSGDAQIANSDMHILVALAADYRLNGTKASRDNATRFLSAWAGTYKPVGNPITEEVFFKYIAGYELVKDDISADIRLQVDSFLRQLFYTAKKSVALREPILSHSNWESRHLLLATAIAYTLGDASMKTYCRRLYQSQISHNILPEGTMRTAIPETVNYPQMASRLNMRISRGMTFDLVHRDAMGYHVSSLYGLVLSAMIAKNQKLNWLDMPGDRSQTLVDSLLFTAPYATRAKIHNEFANTLVSFDKDHKRGGMFDHTLAQNLISLAATLDGRFKAMAKVSMLSPFEKLLYYSSPLAP